MVLLKRLLLISKTSQKITVNFQDIFTFLPPDLQQPAWETPFVLFPKPFVLFPKLGKNLYIVNARESA